jgi:PD-(D/E)XK endonuclease
MNCKHCYQPMSSACSKSKKYCSTRCKRAFKDKLNPVVSLSDLSTGTTGAIGELIASTDLLRKGYEVFRAISPSCSCDLIAVRGTKSLRIEVRTGAHSEKGTIQFNKSNFRADHFAIVVGNQVTYQPELKG